ncbi:MAG: hypothetical protein KDE35_09380 [Geminicoccaceae bacterium]|nr:hypothetical protein [Geminicoccaceae bacterium]
MTTGCVAQRGAPDPVAEAPGTDVTVQWPQASTCPETLAAIEAMADRGALPPSSEGAPLAVLAHGRTPVAFDPDLPLPSATAEGSGAYRCLLTVAAITDPAAGAERRVLREARLRSSYPTGTKRVVNPRYTELRDSLRDETREDGAGRRAITTGDPAIDLVGVIAGGILDGASALWRDDERAGIERELAETGRYEDQPILSPYGYTLTELEAVRRASIVVALLDRRTGEGWRRSLPVEERLDVALSDDRHPDDPTIQHTPSFRPMTSTTLAAWERGAPQVSLRRIAAAMRDAARAPAAPLTLAAVIDETRSADAAPRALVRRDAPEGSIADVAPAAGLPARDAAALDPSTDHRVRLGEAGHAVGFFVTPDELVTPLDVLPRSSLVALTYADGEVIHGMVERRDPMLGLALVYSPREGTPLALDERAAPIRPTATPSHGEPLMSEAGVTGVWLADRRIVPARSLAGLLGSRQTPE